MTNLDNIFKSRDVTLPTKVRLVKAMVFPVVMYGCESWTVKKPERRRIDAFELWCWRRLLKGLQVLRVCKEIQPVNSEVDQSWDFFGGNDAEAETPILRQHIWQRADSFEMTLMLEKIEGRRRRGQQRMRWLDSITNSMDMNLGKLREMVKA